MFKIKTSYKVSIQVITITVVSVFLLIQQGLFAASWTPPPSSPPEGNVDRPINTGPNTQVKDGNLSVNRLGITHTVPTILFQDTDHKSWTARTWGNSFVIHSDDRMPSGPNSFQLRLSAIASVPGDADDWASFSGQVRSNSVSTGNIDGNRLKLSLPNNPSIELDSDTHPSWRILVGETLRFDVDRGWGFSPLRAAAPIQFHVGSVRDGSQDWARFGGKVHSREYCGIAGGNCFRANDVIVLKDAVAGLAGYYQCPYDSTVDKVVGHVGCPTECTGQITTESDCAVYEMYRQKTADRRCRLVRINECTLIGG